MRAILLNGEKVLFMALMDNFSCVHKKGTFCGISISSCSNKCKAYGLCYECRYWFSLDGNSPCFSCLNSQKNKTDK